MNKRIECGTYRVAENKIYHYAGYECAAWSQDVEVAAGSYPVFAILDGERVKWFVVNLPGIIVSDNFQSLFGGMPVGRSYDTNQNAGKPSEYHIQMHDYVVFGSMANSQQSPWTIDVAQLPHIGSCLNTVCGSYVTLHGNPRHCPKCAVAMEEEGKRNIEARHSFLLDSAYVVRPTEFSSIVDSTIYQYFRDGKAGYHRDQLIKVVAGLRKAGPVGRKAAKARFSPRVRHSLPATAPNKHREALTAFVTSLSESEETIRNAVQD